MLTVSRSSQDASASRPAVTLAVLTCLNALNYLDRFLLAPVLPLVIASLGLSDKQAGSLQSAFILVFAMVSPLAGWLGDRARRLHVAAAGVALWSLATAGSGLASTFAWLLLARSFVGVGEATYTVITPSLISDHYPAAKRARALAIFYAAIPVGSAIGYIVGGQLGAHHGWRAVFFVVGAPGLLFSLALLFLREPIRGALDDGPAEKLPARAFLNVLRRRPSYFVNVAAQTLFTFSVGGMAAWMPTYFVRERHLGVDQAGTIFGGILVVTGFLGTILGGLVAQRLERRYRSAAFGFPGLSLIAALPFALVAVLAPQPALYWSGMAGTLFCLFLNYGPLNAALVNVLPSQARARGVGVHTTTIHLLGDACSPFLIGVASDAIGLRIPIVATGVIVALSGVVLLAGRRALVRDLDANANHDRGARS